MNLTQDQKALLRRIVDAYNGGHRSQFFFLQSMGGHKTLLFEDNLSIPVQADTLDFERLEAEGLLDLQYSKNASLKGKLTERGIEVVKNDFAEEDRPIDENRARGALDPRQAERLITDLIAEIDDIRKLPYDDPRVDEWEMKVSSVLASAGLDARASNFCSLTQTEQFSPYAEVWATETESDDVKHRRLCEKRRAVLNAALFDLQNLTSPDFNMEGYALHPEIENVSGQLLRDGHLRQAVHDAYIRVIEEVQNKSGLVDRSGNPMDGEPLMRRAFDCENSTQPAIQFNKLSTRIERDEQLGFMYLFLGIVKLRHTKAHSTQSLNDPNRAYEDLSLASLLMRLLQTRIV